MDDKKEKKRSFQALLLTVWVKRKKTNFFPPHKNKSVYNPTHASFKIFTTYANSYLTASDLFFSYAYVCMQFGKIGTPVLTV